MTEITYDKVISKVDSFISLDISVNSTGWVRKRGDKVEWGIYHLAKGTDLSRRIEFENFLEGLMGDYQYDRVFVEDVIMGCNFETTRILILLNIAVDDLMRYKRVKQAPITRINNTVWKKHLKLLAKHDVKGQDDKLMIRETLNGIGFTADIQDMYDAMGIAVAVIYVENAQIDEGILESTVMPKKVRPDISRGYTIVECKNQEDMEKKAEKLKGRSREIIYVNYNEHYKNVVEQVKSMIIQSGKDYAVYCIHTPLDRVGAMCVTKGFDLSRDDTYFIAYRKNK